MNGKTFPHKVRLILIGAGGRGTIYARLSLLMSHKVQVVAVAEPRDFFRDRIAKICDSPEENCFSDWHEVFLREKFADAVVITTQDQMHVEPSLAFAQKGYHILLEKPLAPDADSCRSFARRKKRGHGRR
jgi:predicted dehydrogenase